ncbi:carboxypeptidase-like regulatory domain-containing protein [Niabella sp. CC-SYL272]|uniref:carboxypeptidase-like regulatory domain-containing protein n=1 Tax=Niabella agricola TaxID=2891571 RepID=UPI001F15AAF7|nr:carboxypeptidase-like regulatory domain-containing protein [Niabella agricola]MCF3110386.1 carboxypeptidase-like regulatory domain-containing protein [Niabella agricola]
MNVLKAIFLLGLLPAFLSTEAQVQIKGNVYDSLGRTPVPLVSVLTSSGAGTMTGADGSYSIQVRPQDSIWFSYLNKPTRKFPVSGITMPYAFDISLRISIPDLPEVKVRNRDYRLDSLENRETYRKYFDFQKPGLSTMSVTDGFGAAFDLDGIINAFRFGRTRKLTRFRDKLIADEQEAYIRYRFSKALIRRITGMTEDSIINNFIALYQPSYLFTNRVNDYTFHEYIKKSYERFKLGLLPPPMWKEGLTGDEELEY